MGRIGKFYDIELDVTKATINDEELKKILMVFQETWGDEWGGYVLPDYKGSALATFAGEGTLCSGDSEEEAHDRMRDAIKKEIGECTITTRWTFHKYVEYVD